jgi:exosortase/archaeosortase family protein
MPLVASFFYILGGYNAAFHMMILEALGVESMASSNLLHLASGPVVEYSPYCFGLLTITAFMILAFYAPSIHLQERVKWIAWASLILIIVNQGRIVIELILASAWPESLSTVDLMFYPLLPLVALYIWYKGLKSREHLFSLGGKGHARG